MRGRDSFLLLQYVIFNILFFLPLFKCRRIKGLVVRQDLLSGGLNQIVVAGEDGVCVAAVHPGCQQGHQRNDNESHNHGDGARIDGGCDIVQEHI